MACSYYSLYIQMFPPPKSTLPILEPTAPNVRPSRIPNSAPTLRETGLFVARGSFVCTNDTFSTSTYCTSSVHNDHGRGLLTLNAKVRHGVQRGLSATSRQKDSHENLDCSEMDVDGVYVTQGFGVLLFSSTEDGVLSRSTSLSDAYRVGVGHTVLVEFTGLFFLPEEDVSKALGHVGGSLFQKSVEKTKGRKSACRRLNTWFSG